MDTAQKTQADALFELCLLAGVRMDPGIFTAISGLVQMNLPPESVIRILKRISDLKALN